MLHSMCNFSSTPHEIGSSTDCLFTMCAEIPCIFSFASVTDDVVFRSGLYHRRDPRDLESILAFGNLNKSQKWALILHGQLGTLKLAHFNPFLDDATADELPP